MKMLPQNLALFFRAGRGLRPARRAESPLRRRPRESGNPTPMGSRFRGNDTTFSGAQRGISPRSLILLLVLFVMAAPASGTTLVRMSLDQLAEASTEIIRAHVVSQQTVWNPQHTRIYTYTTLALDQTYKGDPPSFPVLQQPGGTLGRTRVFVAGTVQFHARTGYLLFLERSSADPSKFLLVGMVQGAYRIYRDEKTQEEKLILPLGSLTRGVPASGPGSVLAGPAVPVPQFQRDISASLSSPLSIPRGTAIPVAIKSAQLAGLGRMNVRGRTTSDLFPNSGLVIPAGSAISGTAERIGDSWMISWREVSIRGKQVLLSARNTEPAAGALQGLNVVVNVR